ncbi:LON peptidase substrate-binding domain-containing protein, partial [Flavobacteriaceae bacterium]|nr:LON peptidase substrate-binding domain-containing protein [Flavobacteriaceae bacterium]
MAKSKFTTLDNLSFQEFDENSELIPLMTTEDEKEINSESLPETLPILSLRNTVLFPGVVIPITAGRDKSIKLIDDANKGTKVIGVVSQKDETVEDPRAKDINDTGTVARILKVLKMPDGNTTVIIQGKKRFQITEVISEEPYINALISEVAESTPIKNRKEFSAIIDSIKDLALQIIKQSPNIPSEASFAINNIESNSFLVNFVSSNMNLSVDEKQKLLETNDLQERALETLKYMNVEFQKLELKNDIQSKVQNDMSQQQREYFLHQQMKTIQEELGGVSYEEEIDEMKQRAKSKKWDKKIKEHFHKELSKMQRMNPQVSEYSIQRNYLDLFLDLPWNEFSNDKFDLKRAKRILDRDHFGLDDVKRRIIEYLAVLKLRNDMKSPILCLYGPPGVGKTSLGKSIAEALGREYIRMSLGGLRDEAEIRGHRKTYIGAMPGRILQNLKKAGT